MAIGPRTGASPRPGSLAATEVASQITARIERLPFSRVHVRSVGVVGCAHFFDAFDALTIAYVLPLLVARWHLTPFHTGMIISAGYAGQMVGAIALGAAAERYGRLRVLRAALVILSVLSFLSAFAWNAGVFVILRLLQGIGLGGETPVAATYVNEMCPARLRGRIVLMLQTVFAGGLLFTAIASVWIVPHVGWQGMFVLGGAPIILAALLPRLVSESPRWLVSQGHVARADEIVTGIEQEVLASGTVLPPVSSHSLPTHAGTSAFLDLLRGGYASRSLLVWTLALCASVAGYGLSSWMPTLYMTVFKLPLATALQYALATNVGGFVGVLVAIFLIDRGGRRWCFTIGFAGACLPFLYLWSAGLSLEAGSVMLLSAVSFGFLAIPLGTIYAYAPEIYPTRIRALGTGVASSWLRIGAIIGPVLVGAILPRWGIASVFLFFGLTTLVGFIAVRLAGIETRGKTLEEIEV